MKLIKALLAASMLVPAAAQAREGPQADNGGRRAEWRQMREARGDRPAPDANRGDFRGGGDRTPGFRPERRDAPQPAAQDRGRPDVAARQDRPNRWQDRGDRPDNARSSQFGQARPDQFRPDQPRPGQWRGDDRRDDGRRGDDRRADWRNDRRPGFDGNRPQFHPQPPQAAQRDGQWNRNGWRDDGYARRGTDDRRDWNRGWRSNTRYDWNRYRSVNRSAYRLPRYYAPSGWGYGYRRFSIGMTLSSSLWGENYWIDDPYAYRLPDAYGPYRWVRYYDDALLVDIRSGEVVDAVEGIFY